VHGSRGLHRCAMTADRNGDTLPISIGEVGLAPPIRPDPEARAVHYDREWTQ